MWSGSKGLPSSETETVAPRGSRERRTEIARPEAPEQRTTLETTSSSATRSRALSFGGQPASSSVCSRNAADAASAFSSFGKVRIRRSGAPSHYRASTVRSSARGAPAAKAETAAWTATSSARGTREPVAASVEARRASPKSAPARSTASVTPSV